ncbi:hypothetical protein [Actinomadura flavalba]|uniref:hypothetical protein n=1 Tax=Actinomadura flavalba TaxID=1120938 RepID=UPI00036FE4BE|nr:hypothetical protein [Actinomadura flavalba]
MSRSDTRAPRTGLRGLLLVTALWLAVALAPIGFGVDDLRLAFGVAGTPGTATAGSCREYGAGNQARRECRGTFTPDDAARPPLSDVHLPPESDVGEPFAARLNTAGDAARRADLTGRLGALSVPALGLLFLLPLPWGVAYLARGHTPHRATRAILGVAAAGLGLLCAAGLVLSAF